MELSSRMEAAKTPTRRSRTSAWTTRSNIASPARRTQHFTLSTLRLEGNSGPAAIRSQHGTIGAGSPSPMGVFILERSMAPCTASVLRSSVVLLCGAAIWAQDSTADRVKSLEHELKQQKRTLRDYGGLIRYGSENSELPPPAMGENRVIFLGDQITEYWNREHFPGKPWLNRGIAGQTTDQMLVRFRQDVVSLQPKAVVILGGLNDIAGLHGSPSSEEMVADNLMSMTEIAR